MMKEEKPRKNWLEILLTISEILAMLAVVSWVIMCGIAVIMKIC